MSIVRTFIDLCLRESTIYLTLAVTQFQSLFISFDRFGRVLQTYESLIKPNQDISIFINPGLFRAQQLISKTLWFRYRFSCFHFGFQMLLLSLIVYIRRSEDNIWKTV